MYFGQVLSVHIYIKFLVSWVLMPKDLSGAKYPKLNVEEGKCCMWVVPNAVDSGVVDVGLSAIYTSIYCFFGHKVSVALAGFRLRLLGLRVWHLNFTFQSCLNS